MYEFIKTADGWRVFWGVDPLARQQTAPQPADEATRGNGHSAEQPVELPCPRADRNDNPAA